MSEIDGKAAPEGKPSRLEKQIEIAAPVEEVWKALTEAKQLENWFPLEARVAPGLGGKLFSSWGPQWEGEAEIIAWEPGKRFAWKQPTAVVEFTLEARGGKTVVRLVQSGFFTGADWENEWFESTNYGWDFMLLGLRELLERHRGRDRDVAWPRREVRLPRNEVFRKLLGAGGLFREDLAADAKPGANMALTTARGVKLSGHVELLQEPRGICLRIAEWNEALFWLTLEGTDGNIDAQIWISTFGLPPGRSEELVEEWGERLKQILY